MNNRQVALIAGAIASLRKQGTTFAQGYESVDPTIHYAEKYLRWLKTEKSE